MPASACARLGALGSAAWLDFAQTLPCSPPKPCSFPTASELSTLFLLPTPLAPPQPGQTTLYFPVGLKQLYGPIMEWQARLHAAAACCCWLGSASFVVPSNVRSRARCPARQRSSTAAVYPAHGAAGQACRLFDLSWTQLFVAQPSNLADLPSLCLLAQLAGGLLNTLATLPSESSVPHCRLLLPQFAGGFLNILGQERNSTHTSLKLAQLTASAARGTRRLQVRRRC